jgi:hypothetical protein
MMGTGQSLVQGNLNTDVASHGADMVRFGQHTRILSRLAWRLELLSAGGTSTSSGHGRGRLMMAGG